MCGSSSESCQLQMSIFWPCGEICWEHTCVHYMNCHRWRIFCWPGHAWVGVWPPGPTPGVWWGQVMTGEAGGLKWWQVRKVGSGDSTWSDLVYLESTFPSMQGCEAFDHPVLAGYVCDASRYIWFWVVNFWTIFIFLLVNFWIRQCAQAYLGNNLLELTCDHLLVLIVSQLSSLLLCWLFPSNL